MNPLLAKIKDATRRDRLAAKIAEMDAARGRSLTDRERLANMLKALDEIMAEDPPQEGS